MIIEPWVSAESVMKTYKKLQQSLLLHTNRPMRSKDGPLHSIEVFRFVAQQMSIVSSKRKSWDDNIELPTWAELADAWNKVHPDRQRDRWNFCRDYKRAEQSIMLLLYRELK